MIYLDNAATTYPKPAPVRQAVTEAMIQYGANSGRSGYAMSMDTAAKIYECREKACRLFHADTPENVVFTLNCTHGLNMAIKGLLRRGDHVVISDLEHNAVVRPLERMAKMGAIRYSVAHAVPCDPERTVRNFESKITPYTRAIICTHASNVFGVVLPIEALGRLAKRRGLLFLVDAAQSAGIFPIDMQAMHIDALCMPGHKGLYGPMGTGMLITSHGKEMRTIIEGGTGSVSSNLEQPDFMPDRFESGTENTCGIIGLSAGLSFVEEQGIDTIAGHKYELMQMLYHGLSENKNVTLYAPEPKPPYIGPLLSFNVEGMPSELVAQKLDEYGICVRAGLHCAPLAHRAFGTSKGGAVRVCPSVFTTAEEINTFLSVTGKIL